MTDDIFADPMSSGQPQRSSGAWKWVLVALLSGVLLTGLMCCGGFLFLANFGMGLVSREIAEQLEVTPEFQSQIGEIVSFDPNYTESFSEDDENTFVYDVVGKLGSGQVVVQHLTDDDGNEVVVQAWLVDEAGQRSPVTLSTE
ncbi:hypothetical protein [Rhodopirellula sp. MGV]|uniref:hypothetical protein n=1 Tax=Rhodopirellula sp. MGV TaxID=2023130 RepID=UPI000B9733CF|nr:hypothetical protein [Rhodopirellula sp. MGV]OYP36979.1 hypothetical protein CGZ80_06355 [Rhodopirellula sp. MGV]PNY36258.1 hypothetical protein C2E31_14230 [Rhodopirellula baltica]